MLRSATAALAVLLLAASAHAGDGMVRLTSAYDVDTTTERLVDVLEENGLTVFEVVDHTAGAREAGLELAPTRVVIFGNPAVGTPLMQCQRSSAIDLPQKALIWQDEAGDTHLAYNDPSYLARRHGVEGCQEALKKIAGALTRLARAATKE